MAFSTDAARQRDYWESDDVHRAVDHPIVEGFSRQRWQREALDERRQRHPPRIAGKEHRLRGGRRRIERLEEAVDLAAAFVVVVEVAVQP